MDDSISSASDRQIQEQSEQAIELLMEEIFDMLSSKNKIIPNV